MRIPYFLRTICKYLITICLLWSFCATLYIHQNSEDTSSLYYQQFINSTTGLYTDGKQVLDRVVLMRTYYSRIQDSHVSVWPTSHKIETEDRIEVQLKYIPPRYKNTTGVKLIVDLDQASAVSARKRIIQEECPVQRCEFSSNAGDIMRADAVLIRHMSANIQGYMSMRPPNQVWVLFQLESPLHSSDYSRLTNNINWTATYRRDSVIVTPYEKFVTFPNVTMLPKDLPKQNYAATKTSLVAWFVSNCRAKNGRDKYVEELQKYVNVDIYGYCGTKSCPRSLGNKCYKLLRTKYKFYLSFENSNCKDYITEKLYWNAYLNDVVPVVMGAHPDDYAAVAPPHSYIHVDDFESPRDLARYLLRLDRDNALYNSYFRWKDTGHFINTKFWCRLCALVHDTTDNRFSYSNLNYWWRGPNVCTRPSDNPASGNRWASWRGRANNFSNLLP